MEDMSSGFGMTQDSIPTHENRSTCVFLALRITKHTTEMNLGETQQHRERSIGLV